MMRDEYLTPFRAGFYATVGAGYLVFMIWLWHLGAVYLGAALLASVAVLAYLLVKNAPYDPNKFWSLK